MQNHVLIFRTSVVYRQDIKRIDKALSQFTQISSWNIDFEDWEKILRIECIGITAIEISQALRAFNIYAVEL